MHDWTGRLRASGVHLGISLCIATLAGLLVFGLWYPYPYREISGGRSLFLLLVCVDVVMGPLITFTIFNRAKPRRELIMDLSLVGLLQLAALCYGLWTVFVARPVHLVFEYNRLSVVHAVDVDPVLLSRAPKALQAMPLMGPTPLALRQFRDAHEQYDATMAALNGAPLAARSDLWQPYADARSRILAESKPVAELRSRYPGQTALIDARVTETGKPEAQLRTLPLVGRGLAWTVLLDANTAEPLGFLPLDSF
jgi:hypothetical protein